MGSYLIWLEDEFREVDKKLTQEWWDSLTLTERKDAMDTAKRSWSVRERFAEVSAEYTITDSERERLNNDDD